MKPLVHFPGYALLGSVLACAIASAAHADDLKLKDGTRISGTIVGFEDSSFRVKTSYGFALIEKDQVVSIGMGEAAKTPADKPPAAADAKTASVAKPKPESTPATVAPPTAPVSKSPPTVSAPAPPAEVSAVAKNGSPPATSPSPAPAESPHPAKPPAPEPVREQVSGNTYTNETYRFRMFKPPDWDVIASAPAVLPGAITAMGTPDDTTYLLIGQEPAGKSLAADMDATEHRLRNLMENFRPLSEEHITVSGETAVEHHFRGSVEQHDWSGVVVLIARGAKLYTIFGMTRADNDLVQLQENVISRAISSLQFID
ncbi:MAG TPA: hypothetical protein VEJ45_06685 [Candidatus Acidoferrales bacterium]|nr:hypothetical protein [Candidatus Acidoferrales bacterium]